MLGKLIKYDVKATAKTMFPIYLAMVILTVLFSLMIKLRFDEGLLFTAVFLTAFFFRLSLFRLNE